MHNKNLADMTSGNGMVREHTYSELRAMNAAILSKSSESFSAPLFEPIALFEELLDLAEDHPGLMLNIELKDMPAEDEPFAFLCADKVASALAARRLGCRTWINSFSGKIVQRIYRAYGNLFHYHGFYPWNIMGQMEDDPSSFCDVACMLNWDVLPSGKYKMDRMSIPCPEQWLTSLLAEGIMPLTTSFYAHMEDYDLAIRQGSRIIMADDPQKMLDHLREKGFHS